MSLQQTISAQLIGARFSNMEGRSFCSCYILTPAEGDNDAGMLPLKLSVEPKLFLELKAILDKSGSPADVVLTAVMKPAAGGAMKMHVTGCTPAPAVAARPVPATAKASA